MGEQIVKVRFMRFQWGIRAALEVRLETMHIVFSQRTCLYFGHVLGLPMRLNLKGGRLIDLVEEISRHLNVQTVAYIL